MNARTWAMATLALFGAATVVSVLVTTPWRPLQTAAAPFAAAQLSVSDDFADGELAEAKAYASRVRPMSYAALGTGLAVVLLLGVTPAGARLVSAAAAPLGGGWVWRVLLGGVVLSGVLRLATLPFAARIYVVRRDVGLSVQPWGAWWIDVGKGFALSTGLVLLALLGLFALIRLLPSGWPVVAGVAAAGLVLGISFLFPVVVEPVFNRFTPLPPGQLRSSLLDLAERDGVPVRDVLVADASRRTTALNAYVSGLGATRRIVVYDTLIQRVPADEVRLVVAHELGHAARRDVWTGSLLGALGAGTAAGLLGLVLTSGSLLRRSGADSSADPRALALVLATVTVMSTLSGPVQALVSRRIETRADVHALDLAGNPEAFARVQRRLAVDNVADPTPPTTAFGLFASHPTAPQRIAVARGWARAQGLPGITGLAP